MVHRAVAMLRHHVAALLVLALVCAIGQVAILGENPLAFFGPDSFTYIRAAGKLSTALWHIDSLRTAGYPFFLMMLFKLTGGVNYDLAGVCFGGTQGGTVSSQCQTMFYPIIIAQAMLMLVTILECYILAYQLSHRRVVACVAASLIGCNIPIISWERTVYSEMLATTTIVTLFLCYLYFARRPRIWSAVLLGVLTFWAVIVRPFNLYLFIVLLLLLVLYLARKHELRARWKPLVLTMLISGSCLLGYMSLNARENQIFGLTWVTNVNLLGKVMEFHMEFLPVSSQYAQQQKDVQSFFNHPPANDNAYNAFGVAEAYPEEDDGTFGKLGAFAREEIISHPVTFAIADIPDILKTWTAPPLFYATYGYQNGAVVQATQQEIPGVNAYPMWAFGTGSGTAVPWYTNVLMTISTIVLGSYWFLPIALVLTAVWTWKRPKDTNQFILFSLAVSLVSAITLGGGANYLEFYRLRSPMDWAMVVVAVVVIAEAFLAYRAVIRDPKDASFGTLTDREVGSGGSKASLSLGLPAAAFSASQQQPRTGMGASVYDVHSGANASQFPWRSVDPPADKTYLPVFEQETLPRARAVPKHSSKYASPYPPFPEHPEISIVLPCLNEEEAIGGCIDILQRIITQQRLSAEIVVVDNASTDRSAEIARAYGARVVFQPVRGYGNAYLKGFAEARGRYIVMADADNTYDLSEVNDFVQPLREGYDLVMGNRFAGRMQKGAMTFSHRYIGNPILSGILRFFFRTTVRDAHCGMRAFTRASYPKMRLRTGGMEFASEMVINAAKAGLKITERPISYAPRIGESKLHTVRDGWRHLRFMLLYSPTHLFLLPGILLLLLGLAIEAVLAPGPLPLFGHSWDIHTMLLGSVIALLGVQIIMLGLFARFFSLTEELDGEHDGILLFLTRTFTLERGLVLGATILALGFAADAYVLGTWIASGMGQLALVRPTVLGSTGLAIGAEIIFSSFFLSFLQFRKTLHDPDAPLEDAASVRIPQRAGDGITAP